MVSRSSDGHCSSTSDSLDGNLHSCFHDQSRSLTDHPCNGTSELPVGPKLARVVGHLFTLSFAGPSGHCIDLLTSAELTGLSFDVLRDDEVPCVHKGHSLGAASQRAFVRDHDQGETQVSPEPLEKLDDVVTGVFVEVAGGLVCQ